MKAIKHTSRLKLVKSGKVEGRLQLPQRGQIYVDLDQVVPNPANERRTFLEMDEMIASVKAVGIIEPPTVIPLEDGRYQLTTGERRWRAAKAAGVKRIHVIVGEPSDDKTRRLKSLMSNIQRTDLGPVELAQALQSLKDDRAEIKTNLELAKLLGKSEIWVSHMLKIISLPESLQALLAGAQRPIPYDVAQQIARMDNPQVQETLIKRTLEGATVRVIREEARKAKGLDQPDEKIPIYKIKTRWATVTIRFKKGISTSDIVSVLEEAITKERLKIL